jgi:nitrogen-specific signal transduction histidine kinase
MISDLTKTDDLQVQIERLKSGIREIAHEINNPLGVLRMAVYFLETTDPNSEARARYIRMMNESLDKMDEILKHLSRLRDNPPQGDHDKPPADRSA